MRSGVIIAMTRGTKQDKNAPRVPKGDGKCVYCEGKHFVKDCSTLPKERKKWTRSQHLAAKRKKEREQAEKSMAYFVSATHPGGGRKDLASGSAEHPGGGKNPSFLVQRIRTPRVRMEWAKIPVRERKVPKSMGQPWLVEWEVIGRLMAGATKLHIGRAEEQRLGLSSFKTQAENLTR